MIKYKSLEKFSEEQQTIFQSVFGYYYTTLSEQELLDFSNILKNEAPFFYSTLKCNIMIFPNKYDTLKSILEKDPIKIHDIKSYFKIMSLTFDYETDGIFNIKNLMFLKLPKHIKQNKNFLIYFSTIYPDIYATLPKNIQNDIDIAKAYIGQDPYLLEKSPSNIKQNKDITLLAVQKNGMMMGYMSPIFLENEDISIAAIKNTPDALGYLHSKFTNSQDFLEKISDVLLKLKEDDEFYYITNNLLKFRRKDNLYDKLPNKDNISKTKSKI